ncbi:MAG: 4-alpha-glucanotransferase [Verrucomicrobia bacterium]|nr:4-alpha-glucanotransferase [Verrucomicrobiota bacterium]
MQSSGKRSAGILLPAFSPRRNGDLGIGDTLALHEWVDWAADHGVGFLQLLPINENGADESPYSAISSVALEPIYLAIEASEIPGLTSAEVATARLDMTAAIAARLVDYPAVRRAKRTLLELAWSRFEDAAPGVRDEFARFRREETTWLDDYCLFRFLMEWHGETLTWDQWPECCRTPPRARAFLAHERTRDAASIDYRLGYYAFVQWLCFRQWRALRNHAESRGVKLMGDVPIGVSWHSSDVFFERDSFHLDWCGGSPPERMFQHDRFLQQWGQNWGIPLYRWNAMQAQGFPWWKQRIRRLTAIFQLLRIDHILGFYRIYAFPWRPERNRDFADLNPDQAAALNQGRLPRWFMRPDDTAANKAANLRDGDSRLRAVVEAAADAEIIAEDLGCVPDYVRPHLAALGIAGFTIPHWDCNEHGHPRPGSHFAECSFAAYSTHDHDPLGAIWNGLHRATIGHPESHPHSAEAATASAASHTLGTLAEFAAIPKPTHGHWPPFTDAIQWRLIMALFASNSRYAAIMVTELFALENRINRPGTTGGENWRFRLPWTLSEIRTNPALNSASTKLASIIGITRRA